MKKERKRSWGGLKLFCVLMEDKSGNKSALVSKTKKRKNNKRRFNIFMSPLLPKLPLTCLVIKCPFGS